MDGVLTMLQVALVFVILAFSAEVVYNIYMLIEHIYK